MLEFELNGSQFRAEKLSAMNQFHLSRKLAPIIPKIAPVLLKLAKASEVSLKDDIAGLLEAAEPFADGLAAMSTEDSEFVMSVCLSSVKRLQGQNWAPIWNKQANAFQFEDMDLSHMVQISVKVIQGNLGGFINGLLSNSAEVQAKTQIDG